jgi:hypothetical protein
VCVKTMICQDKLGTYMNESCKQRLAFWFLSHRGVHCKCVVEPGLYHRAARVRDVGLRRGTAHRSERPCVFKLSSPRVSPEPVLASRCVSFVSERYHSERGRPYFALTCELMFLDASPLPAKPSPVHSLQKVCSFTFSFICPEPVLATVRLLACNGTKQRRFAHQ